MLSAIAVHSPVAAQSAPLVAQARASGQVGERFDGYLGFVTTPSETLRKQVNAINIRRRSLYLDLARRKGVTSEEVGITAGCSTLARVAVGESYLLGQGGWQRRNPGQSAPRPNYCGG
jgi:uncharacterized protein YdbL (DUF1318 family)